MIVTPESIVALVLAAGFAGIVFTISLIVLFLYNAVLAYVKENKNR